MLRWPVAGPSEYWLLASSLAYKVKSSSTHTVRQIHTRWQQYTQDNYKNTHRTTNNNTHKTTTKIHTKQLTTIHTRHLKIQHVQKVNNSKLRKFPPPPMPALLVMNFRGFPPGCGDSVADFWGWDAHKARIRCPDGVWVVICRKMKYQEGP
jgi:hypothetical protein